MTLRLRSVFLVLWIVAFGESKIQEFTVTCLFFKDCVLPCTFTPSSNVTIRWYRQEDLLGSFLSKEDQWQGSEIGEGRVSLFEDQVAHGNASLLLQQTTKADRGRYSCHVSTMVGTDGSVVIVKVEAPITEVTIALTSDRHARCQTQGVYPPPSVHWATAPPSPLSQLRSTMRMTSDPEGLVSVESTLTRRLSEGTYVCIVKAKYSQEEWIATLLEAAAMAGKPGRSQLIPCVVPRPPRNFTLSWTFSQGRDHSTLLTYDSRTHRTSGPWEGRAELDLEQVLLGNGSLLLLNPESGENTGSYTCSFSSIHSRHVVQTWVNVTSPYTASLTGQEESKLWIIAVIVAVMALLVVAIVICKKFGGGHSEEKDITAEDTEMQPMQTAVVKPVRESAMEGVQLTDDQKDNYT